ncbi:hypothetical protein MD484_g4610, partial [Candolleomyces efflorescens]
MVHTNDPTRVTMPPPLSILSSTIAITYVGTNNLPKQCLPGTFRVRRHRVAAALAWLKEHNPLYGNIEISEDRLHDLPSNAVPDEVMETVRQSTDVDQLEREQATYVPNHEDDEDPDDMDVDTDGGQPAVDAMEVDEVGPTEGMIPSKMNLPPSASHHLGHDIPDDELFAHALLNTAGSSSTRVAVSQEGPTNARAEYAIRHGDFRSEYARRNPVTGQRFDGGPDNPNHLLGAFPHLFPYGQGGFETDQTEPVSYEAHARWAMQYSDRRFRKDLSFMFQVFGVLQKRQVCRAATLQIKHMTDAVHQQLQTLTTADLLKASEEEAANIPFSNPGIRALRKQMSAIRARVTGSDESRQSIRGKIWGTTLVHNNPAMWITLNPPDTHDPLVQVLCGEEIDLDSFCNTAGPDTQHRAVNVASDPYAAAQYFHYVIASVLEVLFGIKAGNGKSRIQRKEGLFGIVQAYIGTVEAQGRGTLHLHLLLWLKDAPTPQICKEALQHPSFRERVRAFVRQNIVADIEEKTTAQVFAIKPDKEASYSRPCDPTADDYQVARVTKTKVLARSLQYHLCKDKVCRVFKHGRLVCKQGAPFNLARDAWVSETGQWGPKRLCDFLNAWNPDLLLTLRCNHDVKILLIGPGTQNLTWYITNYTAKKQGHSHNTSALLAQKHAYHDLQELRAPDAVGRNKRLLQRCANTLARDREFSAPEVVSYLMDWGDRYESHFYVVLRWDAAIRALLRAYPGLKEQNQIHEDRRREHTTDEANDTGPAESFFEPEENYILQFNGEEFEIRNQLKEYICRGDALEDASFLRMFLDTYESTYDPNQSEGADISIVPHGATGQPNARPTSSGRPRHQRIPYRATFGNNKKCRIRRAATHETLPRFTGRWFPRRDNPRTEEFYCASMLMLLVPWRSLEDLKSSTETFSQAFARRLGTTDVFNQTVMDNIQNYYECADHAQNVANDSQNSMTYDAPLEEDLRQQVEVVFGPEVDPTAGLTEADVENARHQHQEARETMYVQQAMLVASGAGMYEAGSFDVVIEGMPKVATVEELDSIAEWAAMLKAITRQHGEVALTSQEPQLAQVNPAAVYALHTVEDEAPDSVSQPRQAGNTPSLRTLLNTAQRRAHDIIVRCHENDAAGVPQQQLLMVIHGQGGTGKSMLIKAITETLAEKGMVDQLGKAATSGVAASPIGGNTIHHYWGLPIHINSRDWISKASKEIKERREKNIANKRMSIGDEMSMLTRPNLTNMSEVGQVVRSQARGASGNSTLPFGGMHIVLLGDFHQFPPVASASQALYCERPGVDDERSALGRQLFLQFNTVVILREQNRSHDLGWNEILNRLRVGECTDDDIDELRKLVLTDPRCDVPDFTSDEWRDAILVTPRHSVRKEWNRMSLLKHSMENGRRRYRIRAYDWESMTGERARVDFRVAIAGLSEKSTGGLEGDIVVTKGMKAMVVTNIATEADVANGTRGVVEDIWVHPEEPAWLPDEEEPRLQEDGSYALIHIPPVILFRPLEPTLLSFPGIPPGLIPITPVTTQSFKVKNGRGEERNIRRTQYALTPAYAFTDYKAQGQTIEKAIIDISKPPTGKGLTPFNAYVALSRGRGRNSIRLLRDFDEELFTHHPSEELREEMGRLENLDALTEIAWAAAQG